MSDYIEIKLIVPSQKADEVSDTLSALGAMAVTYQDAKDSPILEPLPGEVRLWPQTVVTGLFDNNVDITSIKDALIALVGDNTPISDSSLEDKDWIRAWMDQFKPINFGKRLCICPSTYTIEDKSKAVVMLDPGLAFGTGTHPTTALCLEFLDSLDLKDKEVVDYGCGSGILGIAALILGAKQVYAIDIDDQALSASLDNAKRNGVDTKLFLTKNSADLKACPVLVANILAGPLCELENVIASKVVSGGKLALSGLIEEQRDEIIQAYSKDFDIYHTKVQDGWLLVCGIKK